MWRFGTFLCLLIVGSAKGQDKKEVCSLLELCDKAVEVKSEIAEVRELQQNLSLILENQSDILRQQTRILEFQTQILDELSLSGTKSYPLSCADVLRDTKLLIRVPRYSETPFNVACDQRSHGGGWTIILRRNEGGEDFYRGWEDYKHGFGSQGEEFFLGLEKLHAMTNDQIHELLVLIENYNGYQRYELYDDFRIGNESENYILKSLGKASGSAGDNLTAHKGMMFSTKDRDNAKRSDGVVCAIASTGAWWYSRTGDCYRSNLCGKYGNNSYGYGINWFNGKSYEYLQKRAVMMIRPKTSAVN